MVFKPLPPSLRSVLVLPVRLGVGCFRWAVSGFYWHLSLALGAVPVLSFRLNLWCSATVHSVFWAFFSSGLGGIPPTRLFPCASSGRGFKQFACATAFPANPSNTAVKALPSVAGTAGKPAAPYLQR